MAFNFFLPQKRENNTNMATLTNPLLLPNLSENRGTARTHRLTALHRSRGLDIEQRRQGGLQRDRAQERCHLAELQSGLHRVGAVQAPRLAHPPRLLHLLEGGAHAERRHVRR